MGNLCSTITCPSTNEGACCYVDADCTVSDSTSCDNDLGFFQGNSTTCGGVTCPPFPPDQICSLACSSNSPEVIKCSEQPGNLCDGDEGTTGDDIICGSSSSDYIVGGDGQDVICGGDGNDYLYGDKGNDCIYGENDNDVISGGKGNDLIQGDNGDDYLDGGMGDDAISGGDGHDDIIGGPGNDSSDGGLTGIDRRCTGVIPGLFGNADNDYIEGGPGDDYHNGGEDNDECEGGPGDDNFVECELEEPGPTGNGGSKVLVDDDCICSEKDKSMNVFTNLDDGTDCTNPNNSQPTIWVKIPGQTSNITLWTQVTRLSNGDLIDLCPTYQYCGSGNWFYFNDTNGNLLLSGGNGDYKVEVAHLDSCPFGNVINEIGVDNYEVNIP